MIAEDIRELMHYGERIDVEFKEAKRELPKSLWETYSSFANTMGGYIILGIKEHRHKEGAERFEVLQGMKRYYGDNYEKLTAEEQSILAYVWNGDRLSNTELQQLLDINSIEAGKLLHQMVEKQLICFESKNRWSTYFLPESVLTEVKSEVIDTKSEVKEGKSGVKSGVIDPLNLTNAENLVYDCLKADGSITYVAIMEKTSLGHTTVCNAIQRLKELQLIRREGNSRKGRWIVK